MPSARSCSARLAAVASTCTWPPSAPPARSTQHLPACTGSASRKPPCSAALSLPSWLMPCSQRSRAAPVAAASPVQLSSRLCTSRRPWAAAAAAACCGAAGCGCPPQSPSMCRAHSSRPEGCSPESGPVGARPCALAQLSSACSAGRRWGACAGGSKRISSVVMLRAAPSYSAAPCAFHRGARYKHPTCCSSPRISSDLTRPPRSTTRSKAKTGCEGSAGPAQRSTGTLLPSPTSSSPL